MNDAHTKKQSNQGNQAGFYLDLAARSAMRGLGHVEPNPMVGAVIVNTHQANVQANVQDSDQGNNKLFDRIIGIGHHTRFGHLHAEREALANCARNGHDPRGGTLYCTLEPCSHHGKQPPCTQAVIDAGICRVVIARKDPAEISTGGIEILESAGIEVELTDMSPKATHISDPFIHRIQTGLPWVIAKWAQTIDGRIATRVGQSQWISNPRCRARVHRLRAKVDAILIGVGTALADDPMLCARQCRHIRRIAKRVVLDTDGRLPLDSKLVQTASRIPTIVCTANPERLANSPCKVVQTPRSGIGLDIKYALSRLASDFDVLTVLVEAGPRVLGSMLEEELIDEAVVHLAPGIMGDEQAKAVATGRDTPRLLDMRRFELIRSKQIGDDIELHYRKP